MGRISDWLGISPAERAYGHAFRLARQGQFRQAAAALDDVLRERPNDWGALLWRGVFLSEANAYAQALKSLEKAEAVCPGNPVFHLFRGRIHYDHGHLARALASFEAGLAARPGDTLCGAYRALTLFASGEMTAARQALSPKTLPSDSGLESRLLVLVETRLAGHPSARSLAEQIDEEERRHPVPDQATVPGWRERLWALRASLSIRSTPQRRAASRHLHAGDYLLARGACAAACARYSAALELDPAADDVRLALADALLAAGEYAGALEHLRALRQAQPGWQDVEAGIGLAYFRVGNYRAAVEHLQAGAERSVFDFMPAYTCGVCAVRLGEPAAARRWFEHATSMVNPRIAALRLAELYRVLDGA